MGGQFNPVYQSTNYPQWAYRPVVYSRGYTDPYAPWGYGHGWPSGYVSGTHDIPLTAYGPAATYVYPGNGAWGTPYLPPGTVIIQR
jgi:hypothetical protein